MTLESKFQWRQWFLGYLLSFVSITGILLVVLLVRFIAFKTQGLGAMPNIDWPKNAGLILILETFWKFKVAPIANWLPFTLALDLWLRRFLYELHD